MGIKRILPPLLAAALVLGGCSAAGRPAEETGSPVPTATATPTGEPTSTPGATPAPTATATPTGSPAPTATAAPDEEDEDTSAIGEPTPTPVAAGTYTYDSPAGAWTLQLREDGLFTLTGPDGMPHTGEGWITEADGTVTCGPTDIYFEDFAFNGGCSRWSITGSSCVPAIP